ncbi:hypothetical protein CMV_022613 [Castanea mollissima]|uniref:Uncharacterized protein n=1 Tax=Castanea mollissima TaxID=60419 RepID=A0A8J4QUN3_9ROSI|nr:hypothetical protein CMV_022613 [Castanea mollissima]
MFGGNEIKLTLWGSVANQVEESFFTVNPSPFIIIATCLIVKTFKEPIEARWTDGIPSLYRDFGTSAVGLLLGRVLALTSLEISKDMMLKYTEGASATKMIWTKIHLIY